jgi:hypothetical protein
MSEPEQAELDLEWPEGSYERYMAFFGKTVKCTVPVEFWTDDWHDGMRARVYVGTVTGHWGGGVCLQPPLREQGISEERANCFPLKNNMKLEILPGKAKDY